MKQPRLSSLPPLPPGFVLMEDEPSHTPARAWSQNAGQATEPDMPPLPPGFELMPMEDGESWSPNAPQPQQRVDPASIPTKGAIEPYDPSMADQVGQRLYDAGRNVGLPVSQMRRDAASLDAGVRGAADTASFGLADEFAAGMGSLTGIGGERGNFSGNLELQRAVDERDAELNPIARGAGQIAGGVGNAVGLARNGLSLSANAAQAGKGWFARMMGGAADGGLAAGAYGAGSGDGLADRASKAVDYIPAGVVGGAGGELIATGLGAAYRTVMQGAGDVAKGVNPSAIVSQAEQFGIPMSRAQATQSVRQAGIEDQLRSQGAMQGFDGAQREAIGQSIDSVQGQIAGKQPRIATQSAAYDDVPSALRQQRQSVKDASQGRYERTVDDPNILVDSKAVENLPNFIRQSLDADQIVIDPMYHQGAARALAHIDDYVARMPKPSGDVTGVAAQLKWVENLRSSLGKNFPPMGQDAPALKAIKQGIEGWYDDIFDKGLVNASDDVLAELKQARAGWKEYMDIAEPRSKTGRALNPRYEAQARLRAIMDKDMSPEEVGRYLWGASVAVPKASSFMTAKEMKDRLGPDSPAWSGIRQSFWLRATRAGDEAMSPKQIAKNLDGLLNGNGQGVANVMFSMDERKMMTRYMNVMKAMSPNKAGINGSNTANKLMPTLQKFGTDIVAALTGGAGWATGALDPLSALGVSAVTKAVASGGVGAGNSLVRSSRVNAATRNPVPQNPSGLGGASLRGLGQGIMPLLEGPRPLPVAR